MFEPHGGWNRTQSHACTENTHAGTKTCGTTRVTMITHQSTRAATSCLKGATGVEHQSMCAYTHVCVCCLMSEMRSARCTYEKATRDYGPWTRETPFPPTFLINHGGSWIHAHLPYGEKEIYLYWESNSQTNVFWDLHTTTEPAQKVPDAFLDRWRPLFNLISKFPHHLTSLSLERIPDIATVPLGLSCHC